MTKGGNSLKLSNAPQTNSWYKKVLVKFKTQNLSKQKADIKGLENLKLTNAFTKSEKADITKG